ncbi:hypothetical protein CWI49_02810, partial [Neisseria meningitidis]
TVDIFFFKQKPAYDVASCLVGSESCIKDSNVWVAPAKAYLSALSKLEFSAAKRKAQGSGTI